MKIELLVKQAYNFYFSVCSNNAAVPLSICIFIFVFPLPNNNLSIGAVLPELPPFTWFHFTVLRVLPSVGSNLAGNCPERITRSLNYASPPLNILTCYITLHCQMIAIHIRVNVSCYFNLVFDLLNASEIQSN